MTGLCAFERDGNLISEEHALNHEEIKKVFSVRADWSLEDTGC